MKEGVSMKPGWIDDIKLDKAVEYLLGKAKEAENSAENEFGKNVIDPFAALFEIAGFGINYDVWHTNETIRQAQKTLQNHIGEFHQKVLGSVTGWEDLGVGNVVDLVSDGAKIIAEVKNKYNTVSGGKLAGLYKDLHSLVMPNSSKYKGYTAYYVTIIPRRAIRFDNEFTPSDKTTSSKCEKNTKIRTIDGSSFYHLVTGKADALEELFDYLPEVIERSNIKIESTTKEKLKRFFKTAF